MDRLDFSGISNILQKLTDVKASAISYETPNMIYILGIEEKEVLMCRLLKAILEPHGVHGLDILPLKEFLSSIGYNRTDEDLETAYISLEEQIDLGRRVDLVIHINNEVLPIEAKLWAGDQPAQLFDYFNYYKRAGYRIDKIYYLTPHGTKPSKESCLDLDETNIVAISFSGTIVKLLDQLLSESISEDAKFIIKQYREVLDNMTKEEKQKNEITSQIKSIINDDTDLRDSLFKLLKYSDSIRDQYEKDFFENSLKSSAGEEYSVEPCPEGSKLKEDAELNDIKKNARFVIFKDKMLYAYICVDTNLYIAKKFEKDSIPRGWKPYPDNTHAWQWVSYTGGPKKWKLDTIDVGIFHRNINWKQYLV